MNSLFQNTYNTALLDLSGPKKDVPAQSEKLDALEKELRSEAKSDKTKRSSEIAGNASQPTPDQRQKLQQYAPRDANFKYYGNKLGDYSTLLAQQRQDAQRIAQPMLASTLESQKESHKLANANEQYSMLANQFGLNVRADRIWKKAKKKTRMSAQSSWLEKNIFSIHKKTNKPLKEQSRHDGRKATRLERKGVYTRRQPDDVPASARPQRLRVANNV